MKKENILKGIDKDFFNKYPLMVDLIIKASDKIKLKNEKHKEYMRNYRSKNR